MKKQKIFTALLMLLVVFTVKSQTATPPTAGNGTFQDPYQIATLENLYWITQDPSRWMFRSYIQTANIDASSTSGWNPNGSGGFYGFPPIGDTYTDRFSFSRYDGQGYTIDGMYINRPGTDYVGLFGCTEYSDILNLGLTNINITGNWSVAGLVGRNQDGTSVNRCYCTGNVYGVNSVGGLVGRCFNDGTINDSYSTVIVHGTSYVGGLVGSITTSTVRRSYSTGTVYGSGFEIGGFTGYISNSTLINSYSIGYVNNAGSNVGGLIGYKEISTISNSFWNTVTSGQATSAGGTGKTTEEMHVQCLYLDGSEASWDFLIETPNGSQDYWGMNASENGGYPFLAWQGFSQTEECCGFIDFTDPVLVVQNFTIQLDETGNATLTNDDVVTSATDNCPNAYTTFSQSSFDCSDIGTPINVDVTLTDGVGNYDTEMVVITVEDNMVPEIPTLADVTGECSATAETPTTTDNCAGTLTGTTSDDLTYDSQGTYIITWSFDDGNGNILTQEQTVYVTDISAPVADNSELLHIEENCDATVSTTPTATDNCEGEIIGTTTDPLSYTEQGTYTITWSYDDGNGNISTQEQSVTIEDLVDPTLVCQEDQEVNADETGSYTVGTLFDLLFVGDNCGISDTTNNINALYTLEGEEFPVGTTTIVWTVTDNAGNTNTCSFDVSVLEHVGISPIENSRISIYPNPTIGIFNVETDNSYQISVSDIYGKTIIDINSSKGTTDIDLSKYSKGIYIIEFRNSETYSLSKVIKN